MSAPHLTDDWRRALVYGLGASGRAAVELLLGRGIEAIAVDGRGAEELELGDLAHRAGLELELGREPDELPAGVDGVVVSPGVPLERPLLASARRRGVPVIAEVELAFPALNGPVVGVTGSNGKSTTTALAGAMLAASGRAVEVCGNIGVPLSSRVEGPSGRIFVTELSSFQLETIVSFRPVAAALLNLAPDHLDRHASFEDYVAAKLRLFANQDGDDVAVVNADDPLVRDLAVRARRRSFSRLGPVADGCFLDGERVVEVAPGEESRELFRRNDLPLPGVHNLENAMAAALLARAMGAEPAALKAGFSDFRGLPHRMQRVAEIDGVVFYDDSKGTNPAATVKSLEGFPPASVHLILGGRQKGADLSVLRPAVSASVERMYMIGESAQQFADALGDLAGWEMCGDLATAVAAARDRAEAGEVVLLSPACASFDQYKNFSQRGEHFHALVLELAGESVG